MVDRQGLREIVAALKHDLGKYVAWRSVNLDDAAWTGPVQPMLIECLQADVLRTRTGPGGDRPAWEVFAALVAPLPRPLPEPELRVVETAVARLCEAGPLLVAGGAEDIAAVRADIRAAQATIRAQLAALHRRLLAER